MARLMDVTRGGYSASTKRLAEIVRRPLVRQRAGRGTAVVALLAIMAVILVPLTVVAVGSFWSARFIRLAGQLTFDNYIDIFTGTNSGRIFLTTLEFTLGASALALVLGGVQAWIVARTNVPGKAVLRWLPVTPLLLSALVANFGWTALYSRDAGIVNNFLQQNLGFSGPIFNIYSMPGLIVALGTHLAPIPYMIMLSPLSSMGASLDEASRASGAGRLRTLWSVSLPLLRPALLSSFTLAAIVAAHAFETPVILGGPAEIHTYVSEIYRSIAVEVNYSAASALAMVYLALIGLMLWWNRTMTRNEAKYALIVGRGYVATTRTSRTVRFVGAATVIFVFLLSVVQLVAANLFVALLPYYTATGDLPAFTLDNFRRAFTTPRSLEAITNSLVMAAVVASAAVVVSAFLAIVAYKTKLRGRRFAEEVGTLPVSFPPIVFSMAILLTFLSIPGFANLYNTIYLPILVLTVVFLPFALRVVGSGVMSIDNSLLEASASSGARLWTTIRTVVLPLLSVGLTGAFALVLVFSFRELGGIALISPPNVALLPTHVYGLWQTSHLPDLYALNMISFAVTVVALMVLGACLYLISRRVNRRATAELEVGLVEKPSLEKVV